jgi:hypothetical protein
VAVTGDALLVAQRLEQAIAQAKADVLRGVVRVNVQVARGFLHQVDAAVLAQMREHVIEKADAAVDLVLAHAIEVELARDVGFLGLPMNVRRSAFHCLAFSALCGLEHTA